jgi:hypothetical protein
MPEAMVLDRDLLEAMEKAAKRKLSSEEIHAQRVSFVLSSLPKDSRVTRAEVERILAEQEGRAA